MTSYLGDNFHWLNSDYYSRAKEGHPTQFLKILHYALFGSSSVVREHLFANGVDRDIIHLNDMKFFKTITYVLVSPSHIGDVHSLSHTFILSVGKLFLVQD